MYALHYKLMQYPRTLDFFLFQSISSFLCLSFLYLYLNLSNNLYVSSSVSTPPFHTFLFATSILTTAPTLLHPLSLPLVIYLHFYIISVSVSSLLLFLFPFLFLFLFPFPFPFLFPFLFLCPSLSNHTWDLDVGFIIHMAWGFLYVQGRFVEDEEWERSGKCKLKVEQRD